MNATDRAPSSVPADGARTDRWWVFGGLLVLTLIAYWPALRAGFVWNDIDYVTAPHLRSLHGLGRIWFEVGATEQYYPVLHTAFWLQHRLWGDAAAGYHVFNVLLHATSAGLLVAALRRLAVRGAVWAGAIFAVHPVGVESAAWISEQKNTLSLVLYLTAALAYFRFEHTRTRRAYVVASALFALALLTKTVTATLPAALLLLGWWRRGTLRWRFDVRPLLPWLGGGAAFGLFSAWVERHFIGAQGSDFDLGLLDRLVLAGRITWFYVGQTFWPANLVFIYPRWQIDAREAAQWGYLVAAIVVTMALLAVARRSRGPLAAWLFFLGSLFPTIGFFNVYAFKFSFVADHWQYLPCLGLIALAASGGAIAAERWWGGHRWAGPASGFALVGVLAGLTWRQCRPYHDIESFYRAILEKNPAAWLAHNNLGLHLVETGRVAESLPHFETTLRLRPGHAETDANLGGALVKLGRFDEAAPHLEAALRSAQLRRRPSFAELEANWAAVLLQRQRVPEAEAALESAVRAKPDMVEALNLLGLARVRLEKWDAARQAYEDALRIRPDFAAAHLNLALLLTQRGEWAEAARHFEDGLRLGPAPVAARRDFAAVLLRLGRATDAVAQLEAAVRARPDDAALRANLGVALAEAGRVADGISQCEEALRRAPGNPAAQRVLAELRGRPPRTAQPR